MSLFSRLKLPTSPLRGDDFHLTTWLAMGACLSSLAGVFVPRWLSVGIPILIISERVLRMYFLTNGVLESPSNVVHGRWTARVPPNVAPSKKSGVVMFILGARTLHPMGRLAPGMKDLGKHFGAAWEEAEKNSEKWGWKAPTLYGATGDGGTTMIWLTYWKDIERLQAFAHGDAHRLLWNGYLAKRWPNLGIMHETYHAGAKEWETIYHDFHRFGMGDVKVFDEELKLAPPLRKANESNVKTMFGRMGRE